MDGHAQTAGKATVPIEIAGKTYKCTTPRFGIMAEMDDHAANALTNPLTLAMVAAKGQTDAIQELLITKACEQMHKTRVLTAAERNEYYGSAKGSAIVLWGILQENHGKDFLTPDDAMKLINRVPPEELAGFLAAIKHVSGEDDAKNSSGPSPTARAKSKPKGHKRKNRRSNSRGGR
jgi:hypothetical protein